ncbi:hypothetical protein Ait01nite_076350 [Actinoplanes italicus]|uniref:Multicomponent Na+:H+ antiporter subunit F n=1 Tax=Actinoplanes italicus TaxID=113567 RepID=A0A2T0JYV8_9ACTN|nr:monovalent cation/H+ antiporter complex subunit F [Actinoplanes italicus]PRX14725.1 multicomponent Na+:H+ antiporter subunit F [Actinoplanes italicus]GIE34590.1 hypothetical protein Ait01nite_076350 [Actinoplanes italicus]
MIVVAVIAAVFLAAAAGMALARVIRGPSTLDRVVATDVLLAITVCAIATEAAYSRDATGLSILLGLSLLGAVGSVAVARFADPAARPASDPFPELSPELAPAPGAGIRLDRGRRAGTAETGHDEDHPGRSEEPPGHGENSPGLGEESAGNGEERPGRGGESAGSDDDLGAAVRRGS